MESHPGFTLLPTQLDSTIVLADTDAEAEWARIDLSSLTKQEMNYASEFEPDAAATWAAGRVILRHVLGTHLDRDPADIDIRLDSAGKPRVEECEFSVTRARRLVLVAVADDPIGIDLEAVPEHAVAAEAMSLLHPKEQSELEQVPKSELATDFVRVWARKEAFLKALSTGLARDPGMDYIGAAASPNSPHPDVEIFDLESGLPEGYHAAIAFNR
ncbi:4'-phosphopantetheinyl transferase superfamily protein [Brevibacterium sp. CBA3109]|uniref:4'-phosphopantetheinyl transferase superfamily protein n=1 Tax=Brevibacterium koreense TaxID=3140787 RepID=A0AAU7UPL6_9MICO